MPIAEASMAKGFNVVIGYGELGGIDPSFLKNKGFKVYFVPMDRGGINPLKELKTLYSLWSLFQKVRPDVLHLVTIKPYLYGGLIARLTHIPSVVSAIAGLGSLFIKEDFRSKFIRVLLHPIYRLAFGHPNQCVIVQNQEDENFLVAWGVLNPKKVYLIRGSGVNISKFTKFEEPDGKPIVCFAGRLLGDKGVNDFVSAARLLKERGVQARFWLAGDKDFKNPSGLKTKDLDYLHKEGAVEVLGYKKDIATLYAKSHIVCLPSYREGLPKSLIEAAAASRAVVTTDVPGCRDSIIPNKTGLLVPVKDSKKLADALQWLIEHREERIAMGKAGRRLAERDFVINKIVNKHLNIYQHLLENNK